MPANLDHASTVPVRKRDRRNRVTQKATQWSPAVMNVECQQPIFGDVFLHKSVMFKEHSATIRLKVVRVELFHDLLPHRGRPSRWQEERQGQQIEQ